MMVGTSWEQLTLDDEPTRNNIIYHQPCERTTNQTRFTNCSQLFPNHHRATPLAKAKHTRPPPPLRWSSCGGHLPCCSSLEGEAATFGEHTWSCSTMTRPGSTMCFCYDWVMIEQCCLLVIKQSSNHKPNGYLSNDQWLLSNNPWWLIRIIE